MCKIWLDPNNASKWQIGFNSAFKGLRKAKPRLSHLLSWSVRAKFLLRFEFSGTLRCGANSTSPDGLNVRSQIFSCSFTCSIRRGANLLQKNACPYHYTATRTATTAEGKQWYVCDSCAQGSAHPARPDGLYLQQRGRIKLHAVTHG